MTVETIERERDDARALAVRLENEIARLEDTRREIAAQLVILEGQRDAWGGKAATASAEASAFRHQRDVALGALVELLASVNVATLEDPSKLRVANTCALAALVARDVVLKHGREQALHDAVQARLASKPDRAEGR